MSLDTRVEQDPTADRQRGLRERIRESRLGTLLVLAVTAAIVMAGAYVVGRPAAAEAGISPVTLKGAGSGAPPKVGTAAAVQALGVDLTWSEGIDVGTALVILGEIGVDVSRFPTEKHFASWLRLCPPQDESNKTKKRRGHRKGTNRVTIALRMCAQSVGRTMTPLGLFYRRIRSRIGGRGAVKATAHKLACLVYRMLKYGQEYVTQSMEEYEAKVQGNILKSLKRKAAALGFQLSPLSTQ